MEKRVIGVVGGEVIDQNIERTGVSPAITLANAGVFDTEASAVTGHLLIVDATAESSAIAICHINAGAQVIASITGSSDISDTKDTASKVNVYVEGGTIQIQNLTGAEAIISANIV